MGRVLANQSNNIRKLQKKNWNQKKTIFKLKSVIHELTKKNLVVSNDNAYTIMQEFGPNEQLINRLFQKTTKATVQKNYEEEIRKFAITLHFFQGKRMIMCEKNSIIVCHIVKHYQSGIQQLLHHQDCL